MIIEKKTCKCGQSYKTLTPLFGSGFKFLPKLCLDCAFGINMSEKVTVNLAPFFEKRGVTKRGVTSRRGNVIHVNFSGAKASPVVGDAKMRVLYDK